MFKEVFEKIDKIKPKKVKIMGFEIATDDREHTRIPSLDKPALREFVEDEPARSLMKKILEAVQLDDPLLIEGPPAEGKNLTIEYLAALLNRPLYRISLNGQTDVGSLVGKWVPKNKELADQLYDKIKNRSRLTSQSRAILARYEEGGTDTGAGEAGSPRLTQVEAGVRIVPPISKEDLQKIAENESIAISDEAWIWHDSDIIRAIEEGAWLVLDEVNTAEPQILVRLNALLEKGGEMVLSENSSRKVKRDKNFRIFGTMNPPGGRIKGRVQLSEDYVSRWRFVSVETMNEAAILNRLMAREGLAEFPRAQMKDVDNTAAPEKYERLSDVYEADWVRTFLTKYATFFAKIRQAVGRDINTRTGQEQNINYDQRDTVRFMQYILAFRQPGNFHGTVTAAIEAIFTDKLKFKEDKERVSTLAEDIVKLTEPVEKVARKEAGKVDEKLLAIYADLLQNNNVPEEHKAKLREMMQADLQ